MESRSHLRKQLKDAVKEDQGRINIELQKLDECASYCNKELMFIDGTKADKATQDLLSNVAQFLMN